MAPRQNALEMHGAKSKLPAFVSTPQVSPNNSQPDFENVPPKDEDPSHIWNHGALANKDQQTTDASSPETKTKYEMSGFSQLTVVEAGGELDREPAKLRIGRLSIDRGLAEVIGACFLLAIHISLLVLWLKDEAEHPEEYVKMKK